MGGWFLKIERLWRGLWLWSKGRRWFLMRNENGSIGLKGLKGKESWILSCGCGFGCEWL
jgi:hypothetical protein